MRPKSLLKSLEKTAGEYWNVCPETGQFINLIIKDRGCRTVLEIGTSNGYSGIWIAKALKYTDAKKNTATCVANSDSMGKFTATPHPATPILYTIESNKERFNLAKENFKKCGLNKYVMQMLGHAPEDFPVCFPRGIPFLDLVFFDATKSEHLGYFKAVAPYVKKGGLIIADNVISHRKDLTPYLNAIKSSRAWRSIKLKLGNGLLVSKKI